PEPLRRLPVCQVAVLLPPRLHAGEDLGGARETLLPPAEHQACKPRRRAPLVEMRRRLPEPIGNVGRGDPLHQRGPHKLELLVADAAEPVGVRELVEPLRWDLQRLPATVLALGVGDQQRPAVRLTLLRWIPQPPP